MEFSVLDQVPLSRGDSPEEAIKKSIELIKWTEELGYKRYFVAEHHNTTGLISNSPDILMTRLLSATETIEVGSGGILLPQYSPFNIAERALLMESMFPGRVNIGVGNSPGGTELTRLALTDGADSKLSDYTTMLADLIGFMHNSLPVDHRFRRVKAGPRINHQPPVYTLGLTENGARRAAKLGIGFIFGAFINPKHMEQALKIYYNEFQPSVVMPKPQAIICIFIICCDTREEAKEHAKILDHWLLNVTYGRDTTVPTAAEVADKNYSEKELKVIQENRKRCIVGNKEDVKEALLKLPHADEIMVICNIHDFEAKKRSYELLKTL
ncbi:LLM class flavin-dependent oxidoreductase [Macrococcus brunensis]|uniref:LLM class flavin-dependent oxidoreductase n=1 Tax=Macrococcus brunensis TaxID=198483 RepID=UPI001EF14E9B|nr:LLM class flavin-dependent oxidoreductase [Macrococcus brunensis]ULG73333.1 MsnO8 family LLM class oxidoreductase [Macrococcus brunensis]